MSKRSTLDGRVVWIALVAGAVLILTACGSTNGPSHVSVTVNGGTLMEHPGEEARFSATASSLNVPSWDVTAEAIWTSTDVGTITAPGVVTAVSYGTGAVSARYQSAIGTAPIRVAPAGSFLVSGTVATRNGFPLVGAAVEAVSDLGTLRMSTDDSRGGFSLPAAGVTTLRVQMDGFEPDVRQMTMVDDSAIDVVLLPIAGLPSELDGRYSLNILASPSCSMLSAEYRQRTYDARIDDSGRSLFVAVSGAEFFADGPAGFTGVHDGPAVDFAIRADWDNGVNLIEDLPGIGALTFSGTARGVFDGAQIVATFRGTIGLDFAYVLGPQCDATDHQLVLTRLDGR